MKWDQFCITTMQINYTIKPHGKCNESYDRDAKCIIGHCNFAQIYRIRQNFRGEKLSRFLAYRKSFPLNHLLCTVHNGMDLMHRKSFPVNSVLCAQPQKFSPSKVLPYTVPNTIRLPC